MKERRQKLLWERLTVDGLGAATEDLYIRPASWKAVVLSLRLMYIEGDAASWRHFLDHGKIIVEQTGVGELFRCALATMPGIDSFFGGICTPRTKPPLPHFEVDESQPARIRIELAEPLPAPVKVFVALDTLPQRKGK